MRPIGKAVLRAGLVDESVLAEIARWGLPITDVQALRELDTHEEIVAAIRDALESEEHVRVQDTDFDVIRRWLDPEQQRQGTLVLIEDGKRATRKVIFCWTLMHEIALPWTSESIEALLLNGESYLQVVEKGEKTKYFFQDVREVYLGDTKAFIVCAAEPE